MSGNDHHIRDELISLVRGLDADRRNERGPASGDPEGFPVFGEQQQRQFEASPHPMRITEHGTRRYLAVNDAALKLYGYSREEFLKLTLRDTRHPQEHAEQDASFASHTGCLRHSGTRRHVKRSGEIFFVEVITQDVLFHGRPARLSLTVDVTGRLRLQELLWQRQQEFETLAENLPDLVARYDAARRLVYVNAAIENLFGMTRDRLIGRTQREIGLPEDLVALYDDSLKTVFNTACAHKVEFRVSTADGEKMFEALHVPERDATGKVATVVCVARDITSRKRAEGELERQKQILDAVIENLPVGVFIRDVNTLRYLRRNRFAQERFGPKMDSYAGKSIYDLFPREEAERFLESDKPLFETGRMLEIPEQPVTGPSGETRVRLVRKVPLYDEAGRPWLVVGIADDITERKRVEQVLRENEARFSGVVQSAMDAIITVDETQHIVLFNAAAERMFGYSAAEIVEQPLDRLIPARHRDAHRSHVRIFGETGATSRSMEKPGNIIGLRASGEEFPAEASISRLEVGGKRLFTVILRDVTERKRTEDTLHESEEFLRKMIESSRDCIKVLDLDGRLRWINGTGRRLLEIDDVSALNNRSYLDFWNGPDREKAQSALASARDGNASSFEGYGPTMKDGPKWWDEIVTPILDKDGRPGKLLVVSRDITEHKRAEEARIAQAVRQRDALVREVHHRIKNSLQGIVGLLRQKIRRSPAAASEIGETIGQLQSVALVYGLQETRPDGLLSLAGMMDAICSCAETLIGGRVERVFEHESLRPACVGGAEAVSVAVALNELVFNALKHQRTEAGKKRARVTLLETEDAAEIRISNRGRLPKGFDFSKGRSVGNGLELVRTLLASPGGSIAFNGSRDQVEVVLKLAPPLLAGRAANPAR